MRVDIKPLSVNEAFKGRRFKTDKYKKWRRDIGFLLPVLKPVEGQLEIKIHFGFSSKLSDLDNPVKGFMDSLKDKYGIDDRDFYKMVVTKEIVKKGKEFIEFEIKEYI